MSPPRRGTSHSGQRDVIEGIEVAGEITGVGRVVASAAFLAAAGDKEDPADMVAAYSSSFGEADKGTSRSAGSTETRTEVGNAKDGSKVGGQLEAGVLRGTKAECEDQGG